MTDLKKEEVFCPVCGSKNLTSAINKRQLGDRFIGFSTIDEVIYECSDCKEKGDFSFRNDGLYESAMEDLNKRGMINMFDGLNEKGISMAHFERCLGLPQRTTARWKNEGVSAAARTLMKTVITYPWILEVAVKNFEELVAENTLMREGVSAIERVATTVKKSSNPVYLSSPESFSKIYYQTSVETQSKRGVLEPEKKNSQYGISISVAVDNQLALAS
jgi:hypothetical protein